MKNDKFNRSLKNIFIDPRFQIKYSVFITFAGVALTLTNAMFFYFFTQENYALLVDMVDMTEQAKNLLHSELNHITFYLLLCSFVFITILCLWSIVLSHRIAGPIYKMKKTMRSIIAGNHQERLYFREKDEFQELPQLFNEMLDSLEKK